MDKEIIAAIIGAVGAIAAAFIAAFFARKIVKENVNPQFHSYADKNHDAGELMNLAQADIFISAAIGNLFLPKHLDLIEKLLKRKIKIKYLLLTEDRLREAEYYMHGEEIEKLKEAREKVVKTLVKLKKTYSEYFEFREFDKPMTASYICRDIFCEPDNSAAIHVMLYQYKTLAKNSPITYISPKKDGEAYKTTVKCINEMWNDAKELTDATA